MSKSHVPPIFFNAKEMGRSLKEVSKDIIKTESQEVKSRWYHSSQDIDLFIWQDEQDNVIKQQLSFHGQIVEWNLIEGVRTGFIFEDETDQSISQKTAAELVRYDEELQKSTLGQALQLIDCVEVLSRSERELLRYNFQRDPSLGKMSPEQFLKKYKKMELEPPETNGFFARLVKRIRFLIGR